jgi:hypothetical protein
MLNVRHEVWSKAVLCLYQHGSIAYMWDPRWLRFVYDDGFLYVYTMDLLTS